VEILLEPEGLAVCNTHCTTRSCILLFPSSSTGTYCLKCQRWATRLNLWVL